MRTCEKNFLPGMEFKTEDIHSVDLCTCNLATQRPLLPTILVAVQADCSATYTRCRGHLFFSSQYGSPKCLPAIFHLSLNCLITVPQLYSNRLSAVFKLNCFSTTATIPCLHRALQVHSGLQLNARRLRQGPEDALCKAAAAERKFPRTIATRQRTFAGQGTWRCCDFGSQGE